MELISVFVIFIISIIKINADVIPNYRLTTNVLPKFYNLTLTTNLHLNDNSKKFIFNGEVFITIISKKSSLNEIELHSKNLNYTKKEYWDATQPEKKYEFLSHTLDKITEKMTLKMNSNMNQDKIYILHFIYTGEMDDDMHGFYRSSYIDDQNKEKWIASTQFETHHARRAFPCFDEPQFKANFQLTLIHHKTFKTVSNTRIISTIKIDSDTYADYYEQTPLMSTYILAFLVSEFNERGNGDFSVVARPEYYDQTSYSFDIGQKLLIEFDKYLKLSYHDLGIDKMHLAAIPDFSAGAMENWGLVTFRERGVLYDKLSTTSNAQQSIATIIAHEQAHMWFGDLVTCDWWSYAWLNEGFATYFQYMITANIYPDWELDKQFVVDQLQTVFEIDSTIQTNPMTDETVTNFDDLKRMFNSITYNKGASIIRMIRNTMGEVAFQNSLQNYLQENKYKNTIPNDIFKHWEKNWPQSETIWYARRIFDNFTTQVGYPLVTVNVSKDGTNMEISQKRFLINKNDGSDSKLLYTIPFTYTTNQNLNFNITLPEIFLGEKENLTKIIKLTNVDWVIANIQQVGYYRVNYNEENWHKIHHNLMKKNYGGIHSLNRAQIVNDLFNLARSGEISYNLALTCLEYLVNEINYIPWSAAFNGYNYLSIRLGMSLKKNLFDNYILQQINEVYKYLNFNENKNDTKLDIYNRNKVISWSCKYGNQDCIKNVKNLYENMKLNPVPINIRSAVYCNAIRYGNENDFNKLFNKFLIETSPTEKTLIINSLGCVKDNKLIEKYFNIIISDDIRKQDKSSALSSLYSQNPENVSPVFQLITDKYDKLAASMGSYAAVASAISDIANLFTTNQQKKDLETFNRNNKDKFGSSAKTLERAEKIVEENLLWATNNLVNFVNYLEKRKSGATKAFYNSWIILVIGIIMICVF